MSRFPFVDVITEKVQFGGGSGSHDTHVVMESRPSMVVSSGKAIKSRSSKSVYAHQWLLTLPEPPFPDADASKCQPSSTYPTARGRSVSTTRASRLSAPFSENSHPIRSVRSSSVTRPSISDASGCSNKISVFDTGIASATLPPSISGNISSRSSRPSPARSPSPVRTRPLPTSAGVKTIRPKIPSNPNPNIIPSLASRSNLRTLTPTRRPLAPTVGRDPQHEQIPKPTSRPSSLGPRARASVRPVDLVEFPTVAPPNLRSKLPERPVSAGKTRQGAAVTARIYSDLDMAPGSLGPMRRSTLPAASQSKFPVTSPKAKFGSSAPNKVISATENTGFGRTISKNSLDMALRHMDIRQGIGNIRASSLYPNSIPSAAPKHRPVHVSDYVSTATGDKADSEISSCNGSKENDSCSRTNSLNCNTKSPKISRERNADLLGSYRYDAMLSTEDSKTMSWLHGVEDSSDQSELFHHRLEPLPEPFGYV